MKLRLLVVLIAVFSTEVSSDDLANTRCGAKTVGELYQEGWRPVKLDYIKEIDRGRGLILLEDGSLFRADMTSGMRSGDDALLLAKYVRGRENEGYIYNICAGGFDAWVRQLR